MKNVMKTIMRNTKLVMILAFLPALLSAAQVQAVDYKNSYKSPLHSSHANPEYQVQTTAPSAAFQSTSAYSSQWAEESTTPMLNSDGTVNNEAYGVGPKRRPGSIRREGMPGTPEEKDDDEDQPLGDALLPMMMLLCAYAIYKVSRKQSFKSTGKEQLE